MVETVAVPVRVLISYAHDSADAAPGHRERVRRLWTFLRECGVDAQLDVLAANRQRDWTAWMDEQLREARFVLVVASPAYKERAESRAPAGEGRGVKWEARRLRDILYRDGEEGLAEVVGVVLGDGTADDLPDWLTPASRSWYAVPEFTLAAAEPLLRLLTGQDAEQEPPLGPVPSLPHRPPATGAGEDRRPDTSTALRTLVEIRAELGAEVLTSEVSIEGTPLGRRETPLRSLSPEVWSVWEGLRAGPAAAGERLLRAGRALARGLFDEDAMRLVAGLVDRATPGSWVDLVLVGDARVMSLPVELTRLATETGADLGPVALLGGVTVSRRLHAAPLAAPVSVPGPLKVLAAVAAPDESRTPNPPLDVEAEMQAVLDAVAPVSDDPAAQVRILEVASLDQIRRALDADRYHVLHLSAHGSPTSIELEDEDGAPATVSTEQVVGALKDAGRPVPLIVLSSCSGAVSSEAMAAGLVAHGADRVIAMQATVTDTYARTLTTHLYADLVRDPAQSVAQALARARRAAEHRPGEPEDRLPEFGVPLLLCAGGDNPILDPTAPLQRLSQPAVAPSGTTVRELPVGRLIGRRPELRTATAVIRRTESARAAHGSITGVQLVGIGGIGKTALAGRVVARMRDDGWAIAVHEGRWNPGELFASVAAAVAAKPPLLDTARSLASADLTGQVKLALVRQVLAQQRVLVLFDDFEQNLAPGGTAFADPGFDEAFTGLTDHAAVGAVLVTCRYPVPGEDRGLVPIRLPALSAAELRRLFLRLPGLRDLPAEDRRLLTRIVGGHPRLIEFVDALLRGRRTGLGETQVKLRALARDHDITLTGARPMTVAIDDALVLGAADIFLDDLLALLTPEHRAALDQLTVCGAPVSVEDLTVALTGADPPAPLQIAQTTRAVATLTELTLAVPAPTVDGGDSDVLVHPWTAHLLTRHGDVDPALHERAVAVRRRRFDQGRVGYADLVDLPRQLVALSRHDEAAGVSDQISQGLGNALGAAAYLAEVRDLLPPGTAAWLRATKNEYEMVRASGNLDRAHALLVAADAEIQRRMGGGPVGDGQLQADHSVLMIDLGDFATARGRLAGARTHYEAALSHAVHLAAAKSSDGWWQNRPALCHSRLGDLSVATGDSSAATEHYKAALTIRQRLAAIDPTNTDWQRVLSASHERLGDLAFATGDSAAAAEHHQATLTINQRLTTADPTNTDWQRGLSISHERLGDLALAAGDSAAVAEHYQASLTIAARLAATDPTNTDWQRDLSVSHNKLGELAIATGDSATAAEHYEAALIIAERLAATDPTNTEWQRDLSICQNRLGDLAIATGDSAAAAEHLQADLTIAERLAVTDPSNASWQRDLSISHERLGNLAIATGDSATAAEHYRAGLTIVERLAAADPTNVRWRRDVERLRDRMDAGVDVRETQVDVSAKEGTGLSRLRRRLRGRA
jgi:tetratricopeptide (TPR) repeat protein